MCRFLMMRSDAPFETAEVLATFRRKCRESVEYQGHGWGAAWRAAGIWFRHKSLTPIWEDRFEIPKEVGFLIVHARSAFKDTGITIENNMPFYRDERAFVFNGELRGVRLRVPGRIGAEKVFHLIERAVNQVDGDLSKALAANGTVASFEKRLRPRVERRGRGRRSDLRPLPVQRIAGLLHAPLPRRRDPLGVLGAARCVVPCDAERANGDALIDLTIIKVGGGATINLAGIASDLSEPELVAPCVVVHGGNAARDDLAARLKSPTRTITSASGVESVLTDEAALDILTMAYAGLVNKRFVSLCQQHGVNAIGLSGIDGALVRGRRNRGIRVVENGRKRLVHDASGKPKVINTELIGLLLGAGYTPVVTVPILDEDGRAVNTENDFVVALLQKSLCVKRVVQLIEARGLPSRCVRAPKPRARNELPARSKRGKRARVGALGGSSWRFRPWRRADARLFSSETAVSSTRSARRFPAKEH